MITEVRQVKFQYFGKKAISSVDSYSWWIGAELKHGRWYWTHSNEPIKYWAKIGAGNFNLFRKGNRYAILYDMSNFKVIS